MKGDILYPVILSVPDDRRGLMGREKVAFLSQYARRALAVSARRTGAVLEALPKDENKAPLPFNGWHWSITHKSTYVAGVTARLPTGIDLERIRPCSEALFRKAAGPEEWQLARGADPLPVFFRFWTAKEAALKTYGTGLSDLGACRIEEICGECHLKVRYRGASLLIEHFFFDGHIASVVKNDHHVEWTLLTEEESQPPKLIDQLRHAQVPISLT